jgi:Leucine-rich repeat (LRR) protein
VEYSTSDGDAEEPDDYTSKSGTLRWDLFDDYDKTITVEINDDNEIEGDETFDLTLENPNGVELGETSTTVVTIDDDETPPQGILQFSSPLYEFDEGEETVNIPVKRIGGSFGVVSVKCVSFDGSAKAEEDYRDTPDLLEWGHGVDEDKYCKVEIISDTETEGDEAFGLRLEEITGGAAFGDPSIAGVVIHDQPPGTLQFSSATYSVKEDEKSVTLTVTRVNGSYGNISVSYESSDETTTEWHDYIPVIHELNWSDGDDNKFITVAILDDNKHEGDETFNLTLTNPTGGAIIGEPDTAVVTIFDDDPPLPAGTLQFSSDTYSFNEDDDSVEITVTRTGGKDGAVTVECIPSDGSATAGDDYTAVTDTLNWADQEDGEQSCTVPILDDEVFESNETFNLTLDNVTGGADIGDPNSAVVTIEDDDQEAGTLQFSSATYEVNEGDETVTFAVTREGGMDGAVSVDCVSSGGDATPGSDYTAVTEILSWADHEDGDKPCIVEILEDEVFEGDETFNLTLSGETGGAEIGTPDSAEVTIVDNDDPPPSGTLQFSPATYEVVEGEGVVVTIIVTREGGSYGAASVKAATSDGTAEKDSDYEKTTATLMWNDGEDGERTFTVDIVNDSEYEESETFKVKLRKAEGATIGEPGTAEVIIIDDVQVAGTLQFSDATYEVNEGDGTVTFAVTREGSMDGAVSVDCVFSGDSATIGDDYTVVTDELNWGDQDDEDKSCSVTLNDDGDFEGNETFNIALENPTGGADLGDPNTAEVTIVDNDPPEPGTLQFSKAEYSVDEGDETIEITVTRIGGSYGEASVKAVASNGTAKKNKDFEKTTETLNWVDGEAGDKTFTVAIIDDNEIEGNETFTLKLKNAKGAELGKPKKAEVTIIDDDDAGTLQFSSATYSFNEGDGLVEITVTREGGMDGAVSVDCVFSDVSTIGDDYTVVTDELSWGDQDNEDKPCSVTLNDDSEYEGNETFNIALDNPTGGADTGDPDTAVVTIVDNEEPESGTLQFSKAEYSVGEGDGTVEITVTRIDGSYGEASVKAVANNGTAKKNKDFEKVSEKLKWDDGEAGDKTFTVTILDDNKVEDDETFTLKLKNAKGAELGKPKKAEVTIIDDDGGSGNICDDVTQIPTIECEALVALYESTDGDNWTKNEDWIVTDTPCNWEGVTCKGEHVSRLHLYNNNLNGEMPPELGNLSGLERLLLSGNALSGAIPPELGNLSQLQYLWLHENGLCGDIPETLMDTDISPNEGFLKLDDNHLITDVSDELEAWLNDRNPGWEDSQTMCPAESNTVQFVQNSYEVNEADGTVTLKVSRIEGDGAISVDYATAEGSATEDEDYNGKTGTLDWAENDFADKKIKITIHDEGESEEDETFGVELSNPDGAILGTPKRAVVTIIDAGDPGICDEVTEIGKDECDALIALYDETDGENWADNTGWIKTNTPCDWYGVTCVGEHVTRLFLFNNNLNGEIPPELADLTGLERLLLFGNALSGVIPPELGDLGQLEYLWLQNNGLCGDIPDTLTETVIPPNVGYLKLDDNHLNTDVSDEFEAWLDARNPTWDETQTVCPTPIALQFSKSTYNVNENKGTVIITVTRTGSSEGEVSVVCATSDESATAGDDYKELFETLSWADGDSSDKVCQIDILDDSDLESSETFIVSIGYPDGAELGILNTVMVTIVDDE